MEQLLNYDLIREDCVSLQDLAEKLQETCENVQNAINSLQSGWEGTAAEAYIEKITELSGHLPNAKSTIAMAVLFLASCADGYECIDNATKDALIALVGGQAAIDAFDVNNAPDVNLYARVADSYGKEESTEDSTSQETPADATNPSMPASSDSSGGSNPSAGSPEWGYSNESSGGYQFADYAMPMASSLAAGGSSGSLAETNATHLKPSTDSNASANYKNKFTVEIPDSVNQGNYTVTGYDYWLSTGDEMTWSSGTAQATLSELWKKQGSRFKNGIAIVTIDGVDRYLVALSEKFGSAGDIVDIELDNGDVINALIADEKGTDAGSEYGHVLEDGSINILEFEVRRQSYIENGNPTTDTWNLDWDSNSDISKITNNGAICDDDGYVYGQLEDTNVVTSEGTINNAIDWAQTIANDNSHGYSQETRNGPNYDCSSYVLSAYKSAGVDVNGASYTGNMKECLTATGEWQWVEGNPYSNNVELQPGDLLLRDGHTEMYVGDGMTAAAKSNYDGSTGDSSGSEITIAADSNPSLWQGFLRYMPTTKII